MAVLAPALAPRGSGPRPERRVVWRRASSRRFATSPLLPSARPRVASASSDSSSVVSDPDGELVLVVGGAGRVGSRLVSRLAASGVRVRVLTRDPTSDAARALADRHSGDSVEIARGDVTDEDPTKLVEAVRGCTRVVACFGAQRVTSPLADAFARPGPHVTDPTHPAAVNHRGVARLAEASGFSDGNRPLRTHLAVGGVRVEVDRAALATGDAHVVIGTPGRLRQLVEEGSLRADDVRVFVLDEADALTRGSFEADVLFLRAMLRASSDDAGGSRRLSDGARTTSRDDTVSSPQTLQTLAFSATYPPETVARVEAMTRNAARVELCTQATNGLLAVRQFFMTLRSRDENLDEVKEGKEKALLSLFARVAFHQCIVFVKRPARGEALAREIERSGVRAGFVSGATPQTERFDAMRKMRDFELRVLVSTDLTSRGVDLERVSEDSEHRESKQKNKKHSAKQ